MWLKELGVVYSPSHPQHSIHGVVGAMDTAEMRAQLGGFTHRAALCESTLHKSGQCSCVHNSGHMR